MGEALQEEDEEASASVAKAALQLVWTEDRLVVVRERCAVVGEE